MSEVLTLGETMVLLTSAEVAPLRMVRNLVVGVAGSESNVAIGLQRLGVPAAWLGRVGDDEFGERIVASLRAEGVDTSGVIRDSSSPTSLMIKEHRTAGVERIVYYRAAGPGSRLQPEDLDLARIAAASLLHVSGITPALSDSAAAAIDLSIETARAASVPVSFAVNYRRTLWSPEEAVPRLRQLASSSDVLFASEREATMLVGAMDAEKQAAAIAELGPRSVLVTLGARGAAAYLEGTSLVRPAVAVPVLDAVGAGDAFAAGFLARWVHDAPPEDCLMTALRCGAFAVSVPGDWVGFPHADELTMVDHPVGEVLR